LIPVKLGARLTEIGDGLKTLVAKIG